jgi:CubicO group peptidase (beta-lactamase class C family)
MLLASLTLLSLVAGDSTKASVFSSRTSYDLRKELEPQIHRGLATGDWSRFEDGLADSKYGRNVAISIGEWPGGDVRWSGTSKGSNHEETDRTWVASSSKLLASVAIMSLVEEGVLHLDTRANELLPWWTTDPSDSRSEVTLAHCLASISGVGGDVMASDAYCLNFDEAPSMSMEDCARQIYDKNFVHRPGTTFAYGGEHMFLASVMAEKAAGIPFRSLFAQRVSPDITFEHPPNAGDFVIASGGMESSLNEYTSVMTALASGELLNATTLATMLEVRTAGLDIAYSPVAQYGFSWPYAFGSWVECNQPIANESLCARSSTGAFGFYPVIDEEHSYFMVVSRNNREAFVSHVGGTIAAIVVIVCMYCIAIGLLVVQKNKSQLEADQARDEALRPRSRRVQQA